MVEEHSLTLCYLNKALYHPLVLGHISSSVYEGLLPSGLIITTFVEQPLEIHLGDMSVVKALI